MAAGMRPESGDHVGRHAHPAFASHPPLPPLAGEGWDGGTRRRRGRRQGHPLAPTPTLPPTRGREAWPHPPLPPPAGEGWDVGTRRRGGRRQGYPLAPPPPPPPRRGRGGRRPPGRTRRAREGGPPAATP